MAAEQTNITEAVTQVAAEAARVAVLDIVMVDTDNSQRIQNVVPNIGGPIMKQLTFEWETDDKYSELKKFHIRGK